MPPSPDPATPFGNPKVATPSGDDAISAFLAAVDAYPAEIMDKGGAWRVGGAAARAWQQAFDDLRERHENRDKSCCGEGSTEAIRELICVATTVGYECENIADFETIEVISDMVSLACADRDRYRRALADLKHYADAAIAGSERWSPLEVSNTIRGVLRA
jgi:hypothetical protein